MTDNSNVPKFFSLEFHLRFFPRLLWSRIQPKNKEETGTTFTSTFDQMILLVFCLVIAATGLPSALLHGSILGWIMSVLGIIGVLAVVVLSMLSQLDTKLSYGNFLFGVFFFFVFLCFTAGIFIGRTGSTHIWWILSGVIGILLGYFIGLLAGYWLQLLGWIAGLVNILSGCAVIGMIILDIVLLLPK